MPEKQYFTGIDIINAPRIESLTVTENGTYTASSDVIGYSPVVVDTNPPWQPQQDGYSNFWFELTNDTLSPWLNFSAKTKSAVIDWGDGSGEVALDTLTPTHTYSKAGRYIVKVKGVTGIDAQAVSSSQQVGKYLSVLKHVELNNEVTTLAASTFRNEQIKDIVYSNTLALPNYCFQYSSQVKFDEIKATTIGASAFQQCFSLVEVEITDGTTSIGNSAFFQCSFLEKITIASTVSYLGNSAFSYCGSLREIHVKATTPSTLGSSVFANLPNDFIIYVPVGYGDTYKAASGWSIYADHILEEGQTPNRMMLAKFNSAKTDEPQDDMR